MKPVFWKLSMGPGSTGGDFKHVLDVLDWIRQGVVLVHKDTRAKGTSQATQGEQFVEADRLGEYFYLCHGNEEPSIILLGQFTGPANLFSARRGGWAERPFRWIRTSILTKPYAGEPKWWAPNHNSTFVSVPDDELGMFETSILGPYFGMELADFRIEV
jgi:5-methylcytosine-specific restriction protein B